MNTVLVIPAYADPLTVAEAKEHIYVESGVTAQDDILSGQLAAARETVEAEISAYTPRQPLSLMVQTWDLKLDAFPAANYIEIPYRPLVSVGSLTYVDADGATQTMSSANYEADTLRSRVWLAYSETWPVTRDIQNAVTVRFTAGLVATFTAATDDDLTILGRTFALADRARVLNSGGKLPTGLKTATDYFVLTAGSTFNVSLTSGGSAVDIVDTGSGVHYIGVDMAKFVTAKQAMKLLIGHWYVNREAVTHTGGIPKHIEYGVRALCAAAA